MLITFQKKTCWHYLFPCEKDEVLWWPKDVSNFKTAKIARCLVYFVAHKGLSASFFQHVSALNIFEDNHNREKKFEADINER